MSLTPVGAIRLQHRRKRRLNAQNPSLVKSGKQGSLRAGVRRQYHGARRFFVVALGLVKS